MKVVVGVRITGRRQKQKFPTRYTCSKQQSTVPARSGQPLCLHRHVDSQAQQHHKATGVDRDTHHHVLRDPTPRQREIRETFSTSTEDGEAALGLLTRDLAQQWGSRKARELAATAVWLASAAGGHVTGQTIVVDGGLTIT